MGYSLQIIDNFYNNPHEVREFALAMDFGVDGNYPGHRTMPSLNEDVKSHIEKHLSPVHGEIYWPDPKSTTSYCGSYQYTTAADRTWIHSDGTTTWAGVLYLTPDAPLSAGTGIFKHKRTGHIMTPRDKDGNQIKDALDEIYTDAQDYTKWEMVDRVGNVFNRLVLYRGDMFHASLDYFGTNKDNGRLFQTFFFNTEK